MIEFLRLILHIIASFFKPRTKLVAEILVLCQQLNVLRRQVSKRPQLSNTDRFLFVWLYRWFPSVLSAIAILRPETIIRWHRAGFQSYWRERSRKPVGRPRISAELRNLIGAMSRANHLWGAPHIHGELLKLGFTIAQSTVARYMYRGWPPSQGWRTFLTNHVDGIAAIDLFVLPTITHQVEEAPPIWDSALMGEAIGCIAACALNEAVTQREKETGVPPSAEMLEYSNWTLLAQGRKLDLMTAPNDGRSGATPWLFRFELFHRDPTAWLRW